jgi:CheY-like chemotaxis protein
MKKITANFNGKKALVADDYLINQELTKEMLELMGCVVDVAEDGAIALDKFQKNQYDIIIMDVQMPNMDGYAATKNIRELEAKNGLKHIPIIAITASALQGDEEKCLHAGMDDYMSKPIKGEILENTLKKYLTE